MFHSFQNISQHSFLVVFASWRFYPMWLKKCSGALKPRIPKKWIYKYLKSHSQQLDCPIFIIIYNTNLQNLCFRLQEEFEHVVDPVYCWLQQNALKKKNFSSTFLLPKTFNIIHFLKKKDTHFIVTTIMIRCKDVTHFHWRNEPILHVTSLQQLFCFTTLGHISDKS